MEFNRVQLRYVLKPLIKFEPGGFVLNAGIVNFLFMGWWSLRKKPEVQKNIFRIVYCANLMKFELSILRKYKIKSSLFSNFFYFILRVSQQV